jgi:hypothetical protein
MIPMLIVLIKNNRDKVEAENTTSTDEDMTKTAPTKNIGTLLLIRKVPVKVEPKVSLTLLRILGLSFLKLYVNNAWPS